MNRAALTGMILRDASNSIGEPIGETCIVCIDDAW